jgi:hypothetical protein
MDSVSGDMDILSGDMDSVSGYMDSVWGDTDKKPTSQFRRRRNVTQTTPTSDL